MRVLPADLTLDVDLVGLIETVEGAGPSPMSLYLAVITVVIIEHSDNNFVIGLK
jgi:hypothetical protein